MMFATPMTGDHLIDLLIEIVKGLALLASGWYAYRASRNSQKSLESSVNNTIRISDTQAKLNDTAGLVHEIKTNTDGMQQKLVEAVSAAGTAKGVEEERHRQEHTAAEVAKTALQAVAVAAASTPGNGTPVTLPIPPVTKDGE